MTVQSSTDACQNFADDAADELKTTGHDGWLLVIWTELKRKLGREMELRVATSADAGVESEDQGVECPVTAVVRRVRGASNGEMSLQNRVYAVARTRTALSRLRLEMEPFVKLYSTSIQGADESVDSQNINPHVPKRRQ